MCILCIVFISTVYTKSQYLFSIAYFNSTNQNLLFKFVPKNFKKIQLC